MDSPGPTTLFAACAEPIAVASATPLATNTVRAMVANNTMVRLIKRPPLCRGAKEERCQTPAPVRNEGSIPSAEGDVCAPCHKVRQSTKKRLRTSQNPQKAKFAGILFHAVSILENGCGRRLGPA